MQEDKVFKLLITCKDQPGIVADVTNFVFQHGGNIVDLQQHSLGDKDKFFMRLLVNYENLKIDYSDLKTAFAHIAEKFYMDYRFSFDKKRMGILVSKFDHCLLDILQKKQYGELGVEIPWIISNHQDLAYIAEAYNIPFHYLPIKYTDSMSVSEKFIVKQEQENKIIELSRQYSVDFLVMARYMQILTPNIIGSFPNQIINVHHGFLPSFKGAKPYHQAYDKGVKIIGATAHYANEDLDMGPIISQDIAHVNYRYAVEDFISVGRDAEKRVFSHAIKAHAEDKIIVFDSRTIVFD